MYLLLSMMLLIVSSPVTPGHWEGTVKLPTKQVKVAVDLLSNDRGAWSGTIAFPGLGSGPSVFDNVTVAQNSVSAVSQQALCALELKISPDGRSLTGDFVSAALRTVPVPVGLNFVSDSARNRRTPFGPITKELAGTWEGSLALGKTWEGADPATLTFRVTLANGEDGAAIGSATNVFEKGKNAAVTNVRQDGSRVRFEVKSLSAVFEGEHKNGQIVGRWSQFNNDPVPLTLKHAARDSL